MSIEKRGTFGKTDAQHIDSMEILIQIMGKTATTITVPETHTAEDVEGIALSDGDVLKALGERKIVKVVYVPSRLVNIVAK
jgi:leucyl-tRNA synthetase